MNTNPSSLFSLPPPPKGLEDAVALKVYEDKIFLCLTASSIRTKNERNYPDRLKYLFDCVESINLQKKSKSLVLEVIYCTVRHLYWNHLLDYLAINLDAFEKVDLFNFAESSLSLKQLLDCYQLFKKCQEKKIKFPNIFIERSIAGRQLTRRKDIREEKYYKQLEKKLKDSQGSKICPAIDDDLNEPLLDIRREKFVEEITKDNAVDETFLQHLSLRDGSLYDYWKKQSWIDSRNCYC